MKIAYTRRMVDELLNGSLNSVEFEIDPVFGLQVPVSCPGIPQEVLNPRKTWKDPVAYDAQAKKLAAMFQENFKQFADGVPEEVLAAGPRII
jgi:phosphoenolpyruvate carboxykinase (ATP)